MVLQSRLTQAIVGGLLASALVLAGCGGPAVTGSSSSASGSGAGATQTAATCTKKHADQISFFNQQDASTSVEDAIAGYIAVNGYCYPSYKDYQLQSNVGNQALINGQVDVNMELWRFNFSDYYATNTKNGKIVDLGETFDTSAQYLYIPKYTAQAHPDIKTLADVGKNSTLFKDPLHPSKALFINCQLQWHCSVQNQIMLQANGVLNDFYVESPGTEGAEKAAIQAAYQRHQNFVFYWWTPDPFFVNANIEAVPLKLPAYSDACNTKQADMYTAISKGATLKSELTKVTPDYGCSYQVYDIHKGANAKWAASDPAFVAALKKMDILDAPLNATMAYYGKQNDDAKKAALWFFAHYQKEWESWLPAPQLALVKAALAKDGVTLSA